jgi:hypothetical protein
MAVSSVPCALGGQKLDVHAGAFHLPKGVLDEGEVIRPKPLGEPRVRHPDAEVGGVLRDEARGSEPRAERVGVDASFELPEDTVPGVPSNVVMHDSLPRMGPIRTQVFHKCGKA